ncbi:glycosyltransferase family 1 protein [Halobacillus trueperi]|uniref:glycosyltransferase family 1 protein n=1 Tax=Halobacillus trueperi TaxID=156205 RepID=UPI0037359FA6
MTEPIRILQVVGGMNRAGTETMLMNLYRNIDRKRVQFDFISYSPEEAHYDEEIRRLGGRVFHLTHTYSIKELYQVIKKNGPYQAIHSHTLFHCGIANLTAWLAGIKTRISHAHTTLDKSDTLLRKMYLSCMRGAVKLFSTHYLACSEKAGQYLFGKVGPSNKKYIYFPNLINYEECWNVQYIEVRALKRKLDIENKTVIGHIGRFMDAKNHQFLLQVMKILVKKDKNIQLLLVGDGDLRKEIEEKAEEYHLQDHIRFLGIRQDIPTLLQCMDVFVFPSTYEGLGLVLLEAQAAGLPCLVSEAIQPEADLNLDLIWKLKLSEGPDVWAENVLNLVGQKEKDKERVKDRFQNHEHSIPQAVQRVMKIYKQTGGKVYERRIDRFV